MTQITRNMQSLLKKARGARGTEKAQIYEIMANQMSDNKTLETLLFTETGVVATADTGAVTDIVERQMAFNTVDMIGFINLGGYISQWSLTATATFTADNIIDTFSAPSVDNTVTITGTGFTSDMVVELYEDGSIIGSNKSITSLSPTEISYSFDLEGGITNPYILITKGLYSKSLYIVIV